MLKYSALKKYLIDLGFIDEFVPQSHLAFRHVESGTLVLLSLQDDEDEPVRQEDLVSVRRHLVENGLISDQEFSRFASAGGKSTRKRR
jgi:hypothetical protein